MMWFDRYCLGVILVLVAPALWSADVNAAGALAVGVAPGGAQNGFSYGINSNSANTDEAKSEAVSHCRTAKESNDKARSQCMAIGAYSNQCATVAMDPKDGTPGVGWAIAADSAASKQYALASCEATAGPGRAGTCVVSATRCDGDAQ